MSPRQEHAAWCPVQTADLTLDGKLYVGDPNRWSIDGKRARPKCGCHLSGTAKGLRKLKRLQEKKAES